MPFEQIFGQLSKIPNSTKTNAFAPLMWFCGIVLSITTYGMAEFTDIVLKYGMLSVFTCVVLYSMCMYFVIFNKDSSLLQSESYLIQKQKLDIMAGKKKPKTLVNPQNITARPINISERPKSKIISQSPM